MPKKKKAKLEFGHIELALLIRAADHLKDAYIAGQGAAVKATVTNLENIREKLSEALKALIA